jgi:glycosyltransferase involved in cell wall biosynthesis
MLPNNARARQGLPSRFSYFPVRILHVQKVSGIGGSERHLLLLLRELGEAGVEVRIVVAGAHRAGDFTKRLREFGIAHSVVRAGPDLNPLLTAALVREIRAFRPDLVHTHLIHADLHGQPAARFAGVPTVSSFHGTHEFYEREPYRSIARTIGRVPRRTIAISDHVRRFLEGLRIGRPGTIRTIHYGIDASAWLTTETERTAARAELGLRDRDVALGVASRLVPHKGHSFLLEAHSEASRQVPGLRLLIAGDGPLRRDLEQEASALDGTVSFLGFVEDIKRFMCACDVVVFPTQPELCEGFGLAALEAMAAGRPVVATAVPALPEVVGNEKAGILVDPRNAHELATALVNLAQSSALRQEMGAHGHQRAIGDFSLKSMADRTLAVYDEALRG